ncbi:MAG TPA: ATP-binding protein [Chloroflexota bacterium]|nr:ATP-binding protein [Chloroflexota bacterium]
MDEAWPLRENRPAARTTPAVPMRSVRVASAGTRSSPRGGERPAGSPPRERPAPRRAWAGAGRRPHGAAPGHAGEREAERRRARSAGQVALPLVHVSAAPFWAIAGGLALLASGELLQLVIGRPLGPWRELCLVAAAGGAAAMAAWGALNSTAPGRLAPALARWGAFAILASPWCWIAAGCALWAAGMLARWLLPGLGHGWGPFAPGPGRSALQPLLLADVGFLGLAPCFLAGIVLALPPGSATLSRARLAIDAIVLPTALGLLTYLMLGHDGDVPANGDLHLLLVVAYPVAYCAVALGTVLGYRRLDPSALRPAPSTVAPAALPMGGPPAAGASRGYLVWATVGLVAGAFLLAWDTLAPWGMRELAAYAAFLVSFLLVGLEAFEAMIVESPATASGRMGARGSARGRRPAMGRALLPTWWPSWNLPLAGTAAAAVVLVIGTLQLLLARDVRPAMYLGSVGLLALVVSRQFITLVDNARLIARLRVAGELEARLREVGLAVSRSLEQPEVLDLVCQAGQRVFQADTVILWRADARQHRLEAVAAVGSPARDFARDGRTLDLENDQALAVRVFNSARTERVTPSLPGHRSDGFLTTATRSQALLAVPLVSNRRPLGVLVFGSENPDAFVADDVIKAELLAAQAVGAMENARLYGELARRAHEAESLYQLSEATQQARTAGDVACALLEVLRHRLGFVHAAVYRTEGLARPLVPVAVAEDDGPILSVEGSRGARTPGLSTHLTDPILRQVATTGEPMRLDGVPRGDHQFLHEGMQVRLTVPLKLGDQVLGVVDLETSQPQAYTGVGFRTVLSLAAATALRIRNLYLAEEAREIETYRELDRLKSELLQTVSHELRTPLGAIKGFTTTLMEHDRRLSREEKREFLEIIDQESDRLRGLIEDLLDMTKIEAGVLLLDRQAVSVATLVAEAVKAVASHSPEHRFQASVPPDLYVEVDPRRVRQVLHNLLENAVKYSPDGGTIHVHAARGAGVGEGADGARTPSADWVVIGVHDQGIGIARQDLAKVFERFHRVDNEVGRKVGGSGLGLAICRGIVEAHGGRIWAESEPGAGSTFSFTLPLAASAQQLTLADG